MPHLSTVCNVLYFPISCNIPSCLTISCGKTSCMSNRVAKSNCTRLKPRDNVTPALLELHWLPVAERINYKVSLLVQKPSVSHAPDYLTNLLTPASDVPLRSSLHSTRMATWWSREQDGRSLTGRLLWQHPVHRSNSRLTLSSCSTPAFKRHLTIFMFVRAYKTALWNHSVALMTIMMRPRYCGKGRITNVF